MSDKLPPGFSRPQGLPIKATEGTAEIISRDSHSYKSQLLSSSISPGNEQIVLHDYIKGMPEASPPGREASRVLRRAARPGTEEQRVKNAKGPDGTRGFKLGRGRPMSKTATGSQPDLNETPIGKPPFETILENPEQARDGDDYESTLEDWKQTGLMKVDQEPQLVWSKVIPVSSGFSQMANALTADKDEVRKLRRQKIQQTQESVPPEMNPKDFESLDGLKGYIMKVHVYYEEELNIMSGKMEVLQEAIAQLKAEKSSGVLLISDLHSQISEKDAEISTLKQQLENEREKSQKIGEEFEKLLRSLDSMKLKEESARKHAEAIEIQQEEIQEKVKLAENHFEMVAQSTLQMESLQKENAELRELLEKARNEARNLGLAGNVVNPQDPNVEHLMMKFQQVSGLANILMRDLTESKSREDFSKQRVQILEAELRRFTEDENAVRNNKPGFFDSFGENQGQGIRPPGQAYFDQRFPPQRPFPEPENPPNHPPPAPMPHYFRPGGPQEAPHFPPQQMSENPPMNYYPQFPPNPQYSGAPIPGMQRIPQDRQIHQFLGPSTQGRFNGGEEQIPPQFQPGFSHLNQLQGFGRPPQGPGNLGLIPSSVLLKGEPQRRDPPQNPPPNNPQNAEFFDPAIVSLGPGHPGQQQNLPDQQSGFNPDSLFDKRM